MLNIRSYRGSSCEKKIKFASLKVYSFTLLQFDIFIVLQIKKFYIFQTQLYELSTLAEALPNNGCDMMDDSNDTVVTPSPEPKDSKVQYDTERSRSAL